MKLDGIIFDLDGTLADTLPVCLTAFRQALCGCAAFDLSDEEIMACFGPSEEGIFQRLVPDRWEACLAAYLAAYEREHRRLARLFPGIEETLQWLQARGVSRAIVTGKGPASAAVSMAQLGLARYVDLLETGVPEGGIKPAAIGRVVGRWGAAPARIAYVGDAASDLEAARAAGVLPVGAAWDPRASAALLSRLAPRATFERVGDFLRWLEAGLESPEAPRAERSG